MKKTMLKLVGTILLVTAIVMTQIPVPETNASSTTANNGFMMDGNKLVKYTGTATSVSVPDGVKVIGSEAFAENTALSYVTFPDSLEEIENGAFSGCKYLNRVILPEGCQTIGNGAFADCENLSSVTLPASLSSLGTSVFAGCSDLKTIGIADGNTKFVCVDGVLYNADKTVIYQVLAGREKSTYQMPNTVEEIKKYAFWGCGNLEEVGLSSNLDRIGDYVFSNASGLRTITLPYSVRSIGTKAFEDCRNLEEVTIPVSVTKIDDTAFDGCYQLNINADEGTVAADFFASFEKNNAAKAEYEESVSENNPHWVADTTKNESTDDKSKVNVSDVDNYVEWDVDSPGVLGRTKVVSRQAVILMDASAGTVYGGTEQNATESGNGIVTDETETDESRNVVINGNAIASKAFYRDDTLLSFSIPSGVEEIGDFAFARSGLTSIQIPRGVTKIGNGAFYHCDQLSMVSIPSTVTEIDADAFTYTKWLENWYSGGDVNEFLVVGDGILLAYKGNSQMVTLPSNVKTIAPEVFREHDEIIQVTLPDSVKVIGESAFEGCENLKNISGGSGLVQIKDRAFYKCPIETVRIPAAVESIGLMAFGGTGQTDSVIFLGSQIPKVSYEESATRLSGERDMCFTDITTAIVPSEVTSSKLQGTVLDAECLGFQGNIYTLTETSDKNSATLLQSTETEEQAAIPESIYVYGKQYQTMTTEKSEYAKPKQTVSDNSIQGLMVVDHDDLKNEDIEVAANGSTIDLNGYHFYVSNPGQGTNQLKETIEESFGTVNDENSLFMDLSLYDPTDTVPIKKLGKTPLTITMPVPAELLDDEICLITLDDNGNPEITFCTWLEKDGREYISFDVQHFSSYALYGAEGELKEKVQQKRSNATYGEGLDDTPDTGDYLNIKIILIIGLAALGGFLLLAGFSKRPYRLKKKK